MIDLENIFIPNDYDDYENEFVPPNYPKTDEEVLILKKVLSENFLTNVLSEED